LPAEATEPRGARRARGKVGGRGEGSRFVLGRIVASEEQVRPRLGPAVAQSRGEAVEFLAGEVEEQAADNLGHGLA
jgi:hypothetical protein